MRIQVTGVDHIGWSVVKSHWPVDSRSGKRYDNVHFSHVQFFHCVFILDFSGQFLSRNILLHFHINHLLLWNIKISPEQRPTFDINLQIIEGNIFTLLTVYMKCNSEELKMNSKFLFHIYTKNKKNDVFKLPIFKLYWFLWQVWNWSASEGCMFLLLHNVLVENIFCRAIM